MKTIIDTDLRCPDINKFNFFIIAEINLEKKIPKKLIEELVLSRLLTSIEESRGRQSTRHQFRPPVCWNLVNESMKFVEIDFDLK